MGNRVQTAPTSGDFQLGNNLETTNSIVPVATGFTVDEGAGFPDFTYSDTAENNGGGGNMDDQPGLIYSGPAGTGYFVVAAVDVEVVYAAEGISDPDSGDTVSLDVYVNSTLAITGDEGQTAAANEAATIEFNITAETVALTEGDVLRFALTPVAANEATIDWDVVEGSEWSVQ